jgi:hypothetical protein
MALGRPERRLQRPDDAQLPFATREPANARLGLVTCRRRRRERAAPSENWCGPEHARRQIRQKVDVRSESYFTEWPLIAKLRRNRDGADSVRT